jgi:hypothetical protein
MINETNQPESKSKYKSDLVETMETNKIKLMLECSLGRKVKVTSIKLGEKYNETNDEISYYVWIWEPDDVKEAQFRIHKTPDRALSKPKTEMFLKLGPIDFDTLKTSTIEAKHGLSNIHNANLTDSEKQLEFTVALAVVEVGRMETIITDKKPRETSLDRSTIAECFYIYQESDQTDANGFREHWLGLRDMSRIHYKASVNFTIDDYDMNINCCGCGKSQSGMIYCHNDKKYFCVNCDDNYHKKSIYSTIKNHKRSDYIGFSNIYKSTCDEHKLKPLEYYCADCRAIFCHKCLEENNTTKFHEKHVIHYIQDYLPELNRGAEDLSRQVEDKNRQVDLLLLQNDINAKEVQKVLQNLENSLIERRNRCIKEVEKETLSRNTYLASLCIELQRINYEIESKIAFLKNQKNNADQATFISMANAFNSYINNELSKNLDFLIKTNIEKTNDKLVELDQKLGIGSNTGGNNINNNRGDKL